MPNPTADFPGALHTRIDTSGYGDDPLGGTAPDHVQVHGKIEEELYALGRKIGTGSDIAASGEALFGTGAGTSAWRAITIADVASLQSTLDGKAAVVHSHAIADVTGLQAALDGKAALSHNHTISDVTGLQAALDAKQALDSDLTAIAGLSPANDDVIQRKAGAWTNRTLAQLKADLAIAFNASQITFDDTTVRSISGDSISGDDVQAVIDSAVAFFYPAIDTLDTAVASLQSSVLYAANNLSDLQSASAARSNLGLVAGGGTQTALLAVFEASDGADQITFSITGAAVFNEAGNDADFRVESDTNANMLFVDASTNRVGIGTATPDEVLGVVGNFQLDDAETATKGYRFRTSGSSLDLDFHSAALVISGFDGPGGYVGTQREKFVLKVGEDTSQLCGDWEVSRNPFGAAHHWLGSGALNGQARFNDDMTDSDCYIRGDNDANLFMTDASVDRVGIGLNNPGSKLEVTASGVLGFKVNNSAASGASAGAGIVANMNTEPTAADHRLGFYLFAGNGNNTAGMSAFSSEIWSGTARGTYLVWETTAATTTTRAEKARLDDSGLGLQRSVYFRSTATFTSAIDAIASLSAGNIDIQARGSVRLYLDSNNNGAADTFTLFNNGNSSVIFSIAADGGHISMAAGASIISDTTTGIKIATSTSQKLGFYNATPIVQPATTGTIVGFTAGAGSAVDSAATFTGNTGSAAYTIGDIVRALKQLGFMAA
jgi:hypothetical protein